MVFEIHEIAIPQSLTLIKSNSKIEWKKINLFCVFVGYILYTLNGAPYLATLIYTEAQRLACRTVFAVLAQSP